MEENTSTLDIRAINEKIERESAFIDLLSMEMNKVIVGQKHMVESILVRSGLDATTFADVLRIQIVVMFLCFLMEDASCKLFL